MKYNAEIDFTMPSFRSANRVALCRRYRVHVCTFNTLSTKDLAISAPVVKAGKLMRVCAWLSGRGTGIFNCFEIDWTVDIM